MEQNKILVLGSLNTDLVISTPRLPSDGETLLGSSFQFHYGGKGANQAVAAARQGVKTYLAGRVGQDNFGQGHIISLEQDGINTTHIKTDSKEQSGVAFILLDQSGGNRIIVAPGANGTVSVADVKALEPLLRQCRCLVVQLEIPLEPVLEAIKLANSLGVKTILDPAPAQALPDYIFPKITIITPNETEAKILTGVEIVDLAAAEKAGEELLAKGVKVAAITLGAKGVYVVGEDERFYLPPREVIAVDTVAAGDTFTGVLAAEVAKGTPLACAARFANVAAAFAVTRAGAQPSIPTHLEVTEFLRQD